MGTKGKRRKGCKVPIPYGDSCIPYSPTFSLGMGERERRADFLVAVAPGLVIVPC